MIGYSQPTTQGWSAHMFHCENLALNNQLFFFFQEVIIFWNTLHCNHKLVWNGSNTINIKAALWVLMGWCFNTLRPRQNGCHFPDDIFKWIFLNENVWISINISRQFVLRGPINNIPTLVQVMAWRRPGDKPLSEPMMVRLPTHICVTRPQWVKHQGIWYSFRFW